MRVLTTTLAMTVPEPAASSAFLVAHFGYREDMAFPGGAALSHPDGGPVLFFLRPGLNEVAEEARDAPVRGLVLALTVGDLDVEEARLRAEGVPSLQPIQQDEWGERRFQVADPNGLRIQLVAWAGGQRPY